MCVPTHINPLGVCAFTQTDRCAFFCLAILRSPTPALFVRVIVLCCTPGSVFRPSEAPTCETRCTSFGVKPMLHPAKHPRQRTLLWRLYRFLLHPTCNPLTTGRLCGADLCSRLCWFLLPWFIFVFQSAETVVRTLNSKSSSLK